MTIEITSTFGGILDDWLESLGVSREIDCKARQRPSTPISVTQWTEEVRAAVALAPGPARGLDIGACLKLHHAGPLGYLVVNSRTLGELLETYLLLEKWFYGQNWASAVTGEEHCEISWDRRMGVPDRLVEQLHTSALLTVVRLACPAASNPARVDVMNSDAGERQAYEKAFGCPVMFDQPELRVIFPVAALESSVDIDNALIGATWKKCQQTIREAHPNATEFVRAVQEAIMHFLPAGAPVDSVAGSLDMSRRTFQRRLKEAGCTYRQLLNGIRERHAASLLADAQLSLNDVAFLLGYSEQSAFNHAYRRWTGASPRQIPA